MPKKTKSDLGRPATADLRPRTASAGQPAQSAKNEGGGGHRRTRGARQTEGRVRPPATGAGCTCSPLETTEPPAVSLPPPLSPPGRIEGRQTEPRPVMSTGTQTPRNHRELAQAIFAECNAVQVGRELLESGSERGAAVRARMFETLANWHFGKSNSAAGGPPGRMADVRVIWDLPAPPHEHRDDD